MNIMRKAGATVALTSSLLLAGGALAGPAVAAPTNDQDGLVNVNIGDVTIAEDVNVGVAALIAANVCGVDVARNVAVLARITDRSGATTTACEADTGDVTFVQN